MHAKPDSTSQESTLSLAYLPTLEMAPELLPNEEPPTCPRCLPGAAKEAPCSHLQPQPEPPAAKP